jgi:uncharacterized membrane protein YhaH (DUF805 family)
VGFGATIRHNFSHYADFGGRAQRSQFWWWYLFLIIMQVLLSAADSAFGLQVGRSETDVTVGDTTIPVVNNGVGVLATVFALAILLPTLAVAVRRLHDTDRSGWWIIAPAVAYVAAGVAVGIAVAMGAGPLVLAVLGFGFAVGAVLAIVLLVFYIQKGTAGPNTYGPDPLGQGA